MNIYKCRILLPEFEGETLYTNKIILNAYSKRPVYYAWSYSVPEFKGYVAVEDVEILEETNNE